MLRYRSAFWLIYCRMCWVSPSVMLLSHSGNPARADQTLAHVPVALAHGSTLLIQSHLEAASLSFFQPQCSQVGRRPYALLYAVCLPAFPLPLIHKFVSVIEFSKRWPHHIWPQRGCHDVVQELELPPQLKLRLPVLGLGRPVAELDCACLPTLAKAMFHFLFMDSLLGKLNFGGDLCHSPTHLVLSSSVAVFHHTLYGMNSGQPCQISNQCHPCSLLSSSQPPWCSIPPLPQPVPPPKPGVDKSHPGIFTSCLSTPQHLLKPGSSSICLVWENLNCSLRLMIKGVLLLPFSP